MVCELNRYVSINKQFEGRFPQRIEYNISWSVGHICRGTIHLIRKSFVIGHWQNLHKKNDKGFRDGDLLYFKSNVTTFLFSGVYIIKSIT